MEQRRNYGTEKLLCNLGKKVRTEIKKIIIVHALSNDALLQAWSLPTALFGHFLLCISHQVISDCPRSLVAQQ